MPAVGESLRVLLTLFSFDDNILPNLHPPYYTMIARYSKFKDDVYLPTPKFILLEPNGFMLYFRVDEAPYVSSAEFYGSINMPVVYEERLYTILKQLYGAFHKRDFYWVYENGFKNITDNDTLYYYVAWGLTQLRTHKWINLNYTVVVRNYTRMWNPGLE